MQMRVLMLLIVLQMVLMLGLITHNPLQCPENSLVHIHQWLFGLSLQLVSARLFPLPVKRR